VSTPARVNRRVTRLVTRLVTWLCRIPERGDGRVPPACERDVEFAAETFVIDRNAAWLRSNLRCLQLQVGGVAALGVTLAVESGEVGGALVLATSAWSLLHLRIETLDRRACRRALQESPLDVGLTAIGGFGSLAAGYAADLLRGKDEGALVHAGSLWREDALQEPDIAETFFGLAPEFSGTADELVATCTSLLRT